MTGTKTTTERVEKSAPVPQERLKELSKVRRRLTIGIPKENNPEEKRLALTPEAVDMIVDAGHRIIMEADAGAGVCYSDVRYSEAGAEITSLKEVVFDCDLVFKIAPPTPDEIQIMKNRTTICSMLQLSDISEATIQSMNAKNINAVGYELISDGGSHYPVRCSVSEIEGAAAISVASELLCNTHGGKGVLMGGIPGISPTEVVIVGADAGGRIAAQAALGLGAVVKVFDDDIHNLRQLRNTLGNSIFTSVFQPNVLINAFKSADVVIGAMRYFNTPVRYVISEDVVKTMKKGALIIDLQVKQGGCFETACFLPDNHPQIFEKYGILHYCIPNLSSRVARTTAMALSNIFAPMIVRMGELGGVFGMTKTDTGFRSGLYMFGGKLVNAYVAQHFNMSSNDVGLFLSMY